MLIDEHHTSATAQLVLARRLVRLAVHSEKLHLTI